MANILSSLYALAKNNNGFFKSEKQASFLISHLELRNGLFLESFSFGEFNGATAGREVIVSWDNDGITEIKTVGSSSRKTSIKFTRLSDAQLAEKQAKKQAAILAEEQSHAAWKVKQEKQELFINHYIALELNKLFSLISADLLPQLVNSKAAFDPMYSTHLDAANKEYWELNASK